ncbi:MAG: hypothetical protein ABJ308_13530 [Halieaceae bacterium]
MNMIDYEPRQRDRQSLKQKLVSAVANGDKMAADELRMLMKLNAPEQLPRQGQSPH